MTLALSEATTITISLASLVLALALLALLRIVFRKEPGPPSWRRFRVGLFLERDPHDDKHEQ